MLTWIYVSSKLKTGITIFIYKGKNIETDLQNWRPITLFSGIHRITERCLDIAIIFIARYLLYIVYIFIIYIIYILYSIYFKKRLTYYLTVIIRSKSVKP
jgi:hypothetical protein